MTLRFVLLAVGFLACTSPEPTSSKPTPPPTPAPAPAPASPPPAPVPSSPPLGHKCGMFADDWCPAPAGDPCGEHKDKASCAADARCQGMRYTGESLVACKFDERGFAQNCPTVGCMSQSATPPGRPPGDR